MNIQDLIGFFVVILVFLMTMGQQIGRVKRPGEEASPEIYQEEEEELEEEDRPLPVFIKKTIPKAISKISSRTMEEPYKETSNKLFIESRKQERVSYGKRVLKETPSLKRMVILKILFDKPTWME